MANALQQVTLFLDDTHTVDGVEVVSSSDITPAIATCSTDPTHARPWLMLNTKGIDKYTNLTQGVTAVSQSTIVIQDTRTVADDQQTGWLTALLPDLMGQRIVEQQADPFTGTFKVTMDGIISGIEVDDSNNQITLISLTVKDIRERERGLILFARAESTVIFPWDKERTGIDGYGVAGGWGRINPSDPSAGTLIPDAKGIPCQYKKNSFDPDMPVGAFVLQNTNIFGLPWYDSDTNGNNFWNTRFMKYLVSGYDPDLDGAGETAYGSKMTGQILTGMTVQWRAWNTNDPWKTLRFMPYWQLPAAHPYIPPPRPAVGTNPGSYLGFLSYNGRFKDGRGQVQLQQINVSGDGTANFILPANNQQCEVRVLSGLPPSDEVPLFLELPGGDFLQNAYDGVYSPELTEVRYNQAAMDAIKPRVPLLRAVITSMEEDGKTWLEENWYKTYGYIPQVNDNGELEPYEWKVPDASVPLTELNDTNVIAAKWNHDDTDTINQVNFWYYRDFVGKDGRLQTIQVNPNELNAPGIVALGTHALEYKPVTVRDAVQDPNGYLGDPNRNFRTQELGFQIFKARVADVLDRFKLGGKHLNCSAMKSDPYVRALREGSWCVVGISWLPDYASRRRGLSRLMQVVKISDTDPLVRGLELVDAGEHDEPLTAPTVVSADITEDRQVVVNVTGIPAGAAVRLEVASTDTLPANDSGDWLFGDQQDGVAGAATLTSIVLPEGTIWWRVRMSQVGRRPSAWVGNTSLVIPLALRVINPKLNLEDDGTLTLSWTPSAAVQGIRVYAINQYANEEPPAVLPSYADVDGQLAVFSLPLVPPNTVTYVSVEAYPGYAAGVVSGAAGVNTVIRSVERQPLSLTPSLELTHVTHSLLLGLTADVGFKITSPQNLGGTLRVWTNRLVVNDPLPDDVEDGSLAVDAALFTEVDETTVFDKPGGGTVNALDDVRVHPGQGKFIFAEFTDVVGNTTGQRVFYIKGSGGVIDDTGNLKPGSITNAEQYAATLTPVEAWPISVDGLTPNDRPAGTYAVDTNTGRLKQWDGTHWDDVVSAPNMTGQLTNAQIVDATITPEKVAASAALPQVVAAIGSANPAISLLAYVTGDGLMYRWNGTSWVNSTPTSTLSGQITSGQLADAIIDQTKIAAGLRLPMYGNTFPGTGQLGDVFILTDNQLVYRWNGSGWTADIPAGIISGQITTTQITPGSITTPLLGANAVEAGNVAAGAIIAGKLAAGAVTAGTIAAYAVGATEIAAGAITADKLFVGSSRGAALNVDPNTSDASAWTDTSLPAPATISLRGLTAGIVGMTALASPVNGTSNIIANQHVPLDPNKIYRVRAWVYAAAGTNGSLYLGVIAYDKDGNATAQSGGGGFYTQINTNPTPGQWTEYVGYVGPGQVGSDGLTSTDPNTYTAGAAKTIRLFVILNYLGTSGYMLAQDFRLEEVVPGTLIQDGVITTEKLSANAVEAGNIAAGAVVAGKLSADAVVAGNIAAGVITGREIAAETVTADKLFVTGGGQNLSADPELKDPTAWSTTNIAFTDFAAGGKSGTKGVRSTSGAGLGQVIGLKSIPVDPNKVYRFRVWVRRSGGSNGLFYYGGTFRNGDGTPSNDNSGFIYAAGSGSVPTTDNVWQEYVGTMSVANGEIPVTARWFYPILYLNYPNPNPEPGVVDAQDFRIEEVLPGTLIKDGAITTNHMVANTINGDRITAGTLNADKIIAGTITSDQIDANSVRSAVIVAGVISTSAIAAGAVTSDKISVSTLSALTANLGVIDAGIMYNHAHTMYVYPDASEFAAGSQYFIYSPSFWVRNDGAVYFAGNGTFGGTVNADSGYFSGTINSSTFTTGLANFTGSVNFRGTIKIIQNSIYGENTAGSIRFYDSSETFIRAEIAANWAVGGLDFLGSGGRFYFFADTFLHQYQGSSAYEIQRVFHGGAAATIFRVSDDSRGSLFTVDIPTVNNDTGLSVIYRDESGNYSFKRIRGDNTDTGGSGNRQLRVLN